MRSFDRLSDQIRPTTIEVGGSRYAEGSCVISMGHTRVLCTCSVDTGVPPFRRDSNEGWLTAEYSMLPRATHQRTQRERNKVSGRTMEIQRLIGRSLRPCVDLAKLPGLSLTLDCDVLQADGGTRTASITGAWVALALALRSLERSGRIAENALTGQVAAISLGLVGDSLLLDLDYDEDSNAGVDGNIVLMRDRGLVELQATAEKQVLPLYLVSDYLRLAESGIEQLFRIQDTALNNA